MDEPFAYEVSLLGGTNVAMTAFIGDATNENDAEEKALHLVLAEFPQTYWMVTEVTSLIGTLT